MPQPAAARIIHMWGTQKPQGTYPSKKRRFISTYCGKNDYFRAVATVLQSPSPRVWGAPLAGIRWRRMGWFIPTCVGNTRVLAASNFWPWAHPHVCGEHAGDDSYSPLRAGSSPRMRGTPVGNVRGALKDGLIPTYAGNTW